MSNANDVPPRFGRSGRGFGPTYGGVRKRGISRSDHPVLLRPSQACVAVRRTKYRCQSQGCSPCTQVPDLSLQVSLTQLRERRPDGRIARQRPAKRQPAGNCRGCEIGQNAYGSSRSLVGPATRSPGVPGSWTMSMAKGAAQTDANLAHLACDAVERSEAVPNSGCIAQACEAQHPH